MNAKEKILANIKNNVPAIKEPMPQTNIAHVHFENKEEKFEAALASVGGNAITLSHESIDAFVAKHYPDAKVITSTIDGLTCKNKDANEQDTPHFLEDVDLAIVEGEFGVAENGAVWVKNPKNKHRVLYFIAQRLLIIVPKGALVDTMHEAYERVKFNTSGYGTFISGPSKTADIEQALVIGAHGPTDACVLFV
ncbi:MAG: LUD domain-containing protein [Sulfurospirillum sp.]|nr:LUD domain-containing protein [Sulfurospirillum sp.]